MEWGVGFQSCVISAPADADLLDAENWAMSNKLPFDPSWVQPDWGEATVPGWREGNVVAAPDGELWNLLTFEAKPFPQEKAARIKIHDQGQRISFDPKNGFLDFPGSKAKFSVRRDPETGTYLSLVNPLVDLESLHAIATSPALNSGHRKKHPYRQRNVVALTASQDLWNWRVVTELMADDSGLEAEASILLTGFQYIDWQFDGDDLIYLVRTAYRGTRNFHDANRVVFRRLNNFREPVIKV